MDKYCQNCRQPNPPEASFCRNCSAPLAANAPAGNAGQNANQQWNPPNQAQGNFAPASTDKASGRAMAALGLSAGSLCCAFFTGIPGAVLGWMEINAIKEGRSSPKGMLMAQIGLWGGIAGSVLGAIFMLLWLLSAMSGGAGY